MSMGDGAVDRGVGAEGGGRCPRTPLGRMGQLREADEGLWLLG